MICIPTKIINVFTYLCLSCSDRGRKISLSNCNISQIKMYFCTDENHRIRRNKRTLEYVVAQTEGVCSQAIELLVEGDVILDAAFHGGCNGNLKGIVALCKGQKISEVQQRLTGITCGGKSTSCPDQFAQLLKSISR